MRVVQIIDSLHPGGSERIAVSMANGLAGKVEVSHICVTREEGILKETICKKVQYLYLNKKAPWILGLLKSFVGMWRQTKSMLYMPILLVIFWPLY